MEIFGSRVLHFGAYGLEVIVKGSNFWGFQLFFLNSLLVHIYQISQDPFGKLNWKISVNV